MISQRYISFFSAFAVVFFLFPSAKAAQVDAALDVTTGTVHSCSTLTDGTVRCWGGNWGGQVGSGNTNDQFTPIQVSGISDASGVFANMYHSCAIVTSGAVKCWGANWSGQLGDGTSTDRTSPVSVNGISGATQIAGGSDHTCAIVSGGSVKCWGGNGNGQLGDGTTTDRFTPVTVSGISNAIDLTAGEYHTCAIVSGGTAKCWGKNTDGQLGDGTNTQRTTPVSVSGITTAADIDAGSFHTCATLSNGSAKCWGDNTRGQLGNGSTNGSNSPVTVSGISTATKISANFSYGTDSTHSCAVLSNGSVKCWGDNVSGQLGNGSTSSSPQTTPVSVQSITNATHINVGYGTSCARLSDNTVKCWGDDYSGSLGDGSGDSSASTPVKVLNLTAEDGGGSPPACTESDWSYYDDPAVCPESEVQTRYWTLNNQNCEGGVTHPSSEQISCTYQGGGGTGGFWTQIGSAIHYVTGYVGIGTNNPQAELDVVGDIRLTGNILPNGDICIGQCE
jgi:alpha-tubulin suppressor-like RCC1 family protein